MNSWRTSCHLYSSAKLPCDWVSFSSALLSLCCLLLIYSSTNFASFIVPLSIHLHTSFCASLSTPLLFLNAPTRTRSRQPDDPCQRFRLLARTPAGLKMGVLTDWVISLPLTIIRLYYSGMTSVHKTYQQLLNWNLFFFINYRIVRLTLRYLVSVFAGAFCCFSVLMHSSEGLDAFESA